MTLVLATSSKKDAEKLIKKLLEKAGYYCGESRQIAFGIQFEIKYKNSKIGHLRIYESKKGIKLDASQILSNQHKQKIVGIVNEKLGEEKIQGRKPLLQIRFFRYPRDKEAIEKIEEMLVKEFKGNKLKPHTNKLYFIKINGLTISQFRNGTGCYKENLLN